MHNSTKIFRLEGKVQHYTWGGSKFIPELLELPNPDKRPFAEYWMGAHDNVPSELIIPGSGPVPLNRFIEQQNGDALGPAVQARFGRLPYLFKVLDVKDMLSIQVHPTKKAAELEFEAENKKGTALDAPHRNYKDNNHKPELMLALGDFWLLHGFKPASQLKAVLQKVTELDFLLPVFEKGGYSQLYKTVMEMPQEEVDRRLQPLLNRTIPLYEQGKLGKEGEDFWAARAAKTFNQGDQVDRGIFSVYLFNLVHLKPGEAIFQDAGIPHAYLEGQNMEIMANSDNVLRGGLTNKHIDVAELMKHVRFEPVTPQVIRGSAGEVPAEERFITPASDFELRNIWLDAGEHIRLKAHTAEIFFVYKGTVQAESGAESLLLHKGASMLATAGAEISLQAHQNVVIFRATTPG